MVPAQGVRGQIALLLDLGVVVLDVLWGELQQGRGPQRGAQVVVNDLLIGVHRGPRPVGPDNGVHPVLQPVGQGQLVTGRLPLLLPVGQKLLQPRPGGSQRGVGAVLAQPSALLVRPQVHVHIEQLPLLVE